SFIALWSRKHRKDKRTHICPPRLRRLQNRAKPICLPAPLAASMSSFRKKSRRLSNSTRSSLPRRRLGTRHKLKNSARSFAKRALPLQKAKRGEKSSKTVCENNCRLVRSFASFWMKPVAQHSCFALRDAGKWQIQSPH